jgi:hypothetical protein
MARSNTYAHQGSTGSYSFSTQATGLAMADFMLGKMNSFSMSGPNPLLVEQWRFGIYVQDAWRVTPRLTVNYGLRWHPQKAQKLTDGTVYNFDNSVRLSQPTGGLDNPWQDYPGGNPFPAVTVAAYKFDRNAGFIQYGNYQSLPYDVKPTSVSSWNVSLQRQVGPTWLVSASYIGNSTLHIWTQKPLNPAVLFSGSNCRLANGTTISGTCSTTASSNLNHRRKLNLARNEAPYLGQVAEYDTGGIEKYHGLLLSAQRRAARGFTVNGNYTWSHCIGDGQRSNNGQGDNSGVTYQDPNNRRAETANCGSDRRHAVNLTGVFETPQFQNRIAALTLTGWRLASVCKWSTRAWLTITSGVDRALTGVGSQRPNQILADVFTDKSGGPMTQYLNPGAFALPDLGAYGNLGKANVVGPSSWQFDLSLSRMFEVSEGKRLEFRAEGYNVTNSFRPGDPSTSTNGSTFGQIRSSRDRRVMQFGLKYMF